MPRFNEYVKQASPFLPALPLCHTCEAIHFRSIVDHATLEASPCDVFKGECLVYLFYGRPAYRPSRGTGAVSLQAFMPVSIVIEPSSVTNIKRVAPFDTGALDKQLYASALHPEMKREDFLLDPSIDMAGRLVTTFFGSNRDYFCGTPATSKIPPMEFEAQSYYELIKAQGTTNPDDRRGTIEVQSSNSIPLAAGNVLLVVMPVRFLEDHNVRETVTKTWSAEIRTYYTHHGSPADYTALVYDRVRTFLEERKYL